MRVTVDILWLVWVLIAFTVFLYLSTYIDYDMVLSVKAMFGFSILVGSTFLTGLLFGFTYDWFFSEKELMGYFYGVGLSIVAIAFVNTITPSLAVTPINSALFSVLIGIAEEALFRGLLLTWVWAFTGNSVYGVVVSSAIGAVFHSAIYGVSSTLILIVFGSFCVIGFAYFISGRRLSTAMTAHALLNAVAILGGGG